MDAPGPGIDHAALKDHLRWLKAGRAGPGRLTLRGADLHDASLGASTLTAARLTACNLDGADLSFADLSEAQLIDCSARSAKLLRSKYDRVVMRGCICTDADLRLVFFDGAELRGGDWADVNLERSSFVGAHIEGVNLRRARLMDVPFDDADVRACDFSDADFREIEPVLKLARARRAKFTQCDFRGANLQGWRLGDVTFDRCQFAGSVGRPCVEGALHLAAPDVDEAALRSAWGA